jgi:hypothetical protein
MKARDVVFFEDVFRDSKEQLPSNHARVMIPGFPEEGAKARTELQEIEVVVE